MTSAAIDRPLRDDDSGRVGQEQLIRCFDGILSEEDRAAVAAYLRLPGWSFGWRSNTRDDSFSFWHKHFAGYRKTGDYSFKTGEWPPPDCASELASNAEIVFRLWTVLRSSVLQGHRLVRCYANGLQYGSDGSLHTDADSPASFTSIYYSHQEWHPNWSGETVFFNETKDDIVASIYPKPNRLLVFRGDMPHVARGVARTCPVVRQTLMFKTERTAENHG